MKIIRNTEIKKGTDEFRRVYLCGNLKYSNGVEHIKTNGHEIGITDYSEYTFEKAHFHSFNQEYNYVLEGMLKVFLIAQKKEYIFEKGDLFVIDTNEPYVTKAQPGSKTIFFKIPGGNDKVLVTMDEPLLMWGQHWNNEYKER